MNNIAQTSSGTVGDWFKNSMVANILLLVFAWCLVIALFAMASTNAHAQSGNVYGNAQLLGSAQPAQVLQVRLVTSTASRTWQDQAAGAAIGGALGAAIGNRASDNNRALTITLGTLIGGFAGNRVAERMTQDEAQEIILRMASGQVLVVVQPAPFDAVQAGEQVFLLSQAGQYRIIRNSIGFAASGQQVMPGAAPMAAPMLTPEPRNPFSF